MVSYRRVMMTAFLILAVMVGLVSMAVAQNTSPEELAPAQSLRIEASVGTMFTYQGRLMDNGAPANGTYDFRFRLYTAQTGGSQVGTTKYRNDVPVQNGLFTISLDFGSGVFNGEERWLEVAVRPGTSTGSYTVLAPRQPIRAVPYALSLRPGAVISSADVDVYVNKTVRLYPNLPFYATYGLYAKARAGGANTWAYGVYGVSEDPKGAGGYFANEASDGVGLYVRSGSDSAPDIVLGRNSASADNGVIASEPEDEDSDIILRTNDVVRIDLDADKSGNDADFEIYDKDGNRIFDVDESGTIQSSALTRVFVPGGEAVPHADSINDLQLKYYGRGTVAIRKTSSGSGTEQVVIPVSLPAVLYGQPVKIVDLRVYYRTSNAATYITETDLYREKLNGSYYTLISSGSDRKSTAFTHYTLTCKVTECRLGTEEGFITVLLKIYFASNSHEVTLGGVRLTLAHK